MRIATSQYQAMMTQSLQTNQERITYVTQQMANGNRIQLPSDDPVDSVRLSRLKREEATIAQYRSNVAAVNERLAKNEGFLQNMVNDMGSGRDLLVWASDGSNSSQDLNAMVTSLVSLRDSLLYNANTVDQEGRYVFSGTATGTPAITYDATDKLYKYTGNENDQLVVVGNGITQVGNQNVKGLQDLLNQLDQTISTLSAPSVNANDPAVRSVLKANLDGFDTAMNLIAGKVAVIGGQQNILKTIDANHENVSQSNQTAILDIGQLDVGTAAIELNGYQTALEASYKAYSKIGSLSLFSVVSSSWITRYDPRPPAQPAAPSAPGRMPRPGSFRPAPPVRSTTRQRTRRPARRPPRHRCAPTAARRGSRAACRTRWRAPSRHSTISTAWRPSSRR